jgi:hypothetical protein
LLFFGALSVVTPVFLMLWALLLLLLMTSSLSSSCWCVLELNADLDFFFFTSSPAALYFECWLDTELANTDKERSVVVAKGVLLLFINFKSKLVQSKE